MHPDMRILGRSALDRRLQAVDAEALKVPGSWARTIREVLGMTTRQMAQRLGVSQPRVVAMEKAEENKSITLESLERAARALDCELVYAFVPLQPLEQMVHEHALKAAARKLKPTSHTMALEAQSIPSRMHQEQMQRLAAEMIAKGDSAIWEAE